MIKALKQIKEMVSSSTMITNKETNYITFPALKLLGNCIENIYFFFNLKQRFCLIFNFKPTVLKSKIT